VNIDNIGEKVAEIEETLKTKRAAAEELDTLIEGAKTNLATKQSEVQRLVERKEDRNARIARNAMEARVTAVNQDWGFLVIGAGSNSGFTPQTALLVKRDGRLIGRVNPSAIEPNQTIAEIDLKSLSSGVRIQPGDRVILAKPASN
jgi:chromosome segregation ATPase